MIEPHPIHVDIPFRPWEEELPNGAHLTQLPIDSERLLRLDICFRAGKNTQTMPLQAQLAIGQLPVSSTCYPPERVAELLDYYGATLTATCSQSCACLTLICLPRFLSELLPLLFSLLNEPAYDAGQLEIACDTLLTEWRINRQKVSKISKETLFKQIFPANHPLAQLPEEAHFGQVDGALLRSYWQRYLHAANAAIFLTGKMDREIETLVRKTLGEPVWGGGEAAEVASPPMPSPPKERGFCSVAMPCPTVQTALRAGFILPPLTHADMPALKLTSTILGGYFGSRLMSNIREDKGFTYHIGSRILQCPGGSLLTIGTEVKSGVVWKALEEVEHEVERLSGELVGEEELAIVKNYVAGCACRQYEAHIDIAELLISLWRTGRTIDDLLREHRQLQATTAEEVRRVAQTYLPLEHSVFVLAGDVPDRD